MCAEFAQNQIRGDWANGDAGISQVNVSVLEQQSLLSDFVLQHIRLNLNLREYEWKMLLERLKRVLA
jgi:hypothetical protein